MEKINQEDFEIQAFETEKVENNDIKGKRKINVRFGYITKIRYYFRKFLTSYYANKEQDILNSRDSYATTEAWEVAHDDAIASRDMHNEKMMEHEQRLKEMEQVKKDRAIEKAQGEYNKAMEKFKENATGENLDRVTETEEKLTKLTMDNAQNILAQNVQQIQAHSPEVTEQTVMNDVDATKEISTGEIQMPQESKPDVLGNTKEIPTEDIQTVQQSVPENSVNEQVSSVEVPENKEENVVEKSQSVQEVVPEVSSNGQEVTPVVSEEPVVETEINLEESSKSVKELLDQFTKHGNLFDNNWKIAMQAVSDAVRKYNENVQRDSIEALANKQIELDEQKKVNIKLSQENRDLMSAKNQLNGDLLKSQDEVASLTKSNQEKDNQIQSLTVENENKDREIAEVTTLYNDQLRNVAALTDENTKLKNDVLAMSQQFKQMQEIFNNMMGSSMQQPTTVEEEAVQKVNAK